MTNPGTDVRVNVEIAARINQQPAPWPGFNGPGAIVRATERAPGVLRAGPVRPRKLGHVVVGSTDQESSHRFFTEGIGFKVSDRIPGVAAFMRCSTDHHNVMIQHAPVTMLHHTSWQVEDVDEIGRGAMALLGKDPGGDPRGPDAQAGRSSRRRWAVHEPVNIPFARDFLDGQRRRSSEAPAATA